MFIYRVVHLLPGVFGVYDR